MLIQRKCFLNVWMESLLLWGHGDIVVFQYPTWNDIKFDKGLISSLSHYRGIKKIFFIHDILSLMFESNRCYLKEHIDFLIRLI